MTYKTILVHCSDERRLPGVLGPAIAVARRCEAHLIIVLAMSTYKAINYYASKLLD